MGEGLLRLTVNILAFIRLTVNFLGFFTANGYFFFPLRLTGVVKN